MLWGRGRIPGAVCKLSKPENKAACSSVWHGRLRDDSKAARPLNMLKQLLVLTQPHTYMEKLQLACEGVSGEHGEIPPFIHGIHPLLAAPTPRMFQCKYQVVHSTSQGNTQKPQPISKSAKCWFA